MRKIEMSFIISNWTLATWNNHLGDSSVVLKAQKLVHPIARPSLYTFWHIWSVLKSVCVGCEVKPGCSAKFGGSATGVGRRESERGVTWCSQRVLRCATKNFKCIACSDAAVESGLAPPAPAGHDERFSTSKASGWMLPLHSPPSD